MHILVGVFHDTGYISEDNGHEAKVHKIGRLVAEPVLVAVVDEKLDIGRHPERLDGRQVEAENMGAWEPIGHCMCRTSVRPHCHGLLGEDMPSIAQMPARCSCQPRVMTPCMSWCADTALPVPVPQSMMCCGFLTGE